MSENAIRKSLARGKSLAVVAIFTAAALGACVPMAPIGGGPGPLPQPGPAPAPTPIANLACEQRVGDNGGHGFWDIGRGECWSCPLQSARTVFPVNENWACSFGGMFSTAWAPAEYLGGR